MKENLLALLEDGMHESARLLVARVREGNATAAEISQIRAMFRDAGGILAFQSKPTELGDRILESMADVDADMLN